MTKIQSEKVEINNSVENVFNFLSNFNNFEKLMPEQVSNWSSNENECAFTISGMATIGMKIVEKTPYSAIKISSSGKVPFNFELFIFLNELGPKKSQGQLIFEAQLNPMLKMMVEKPLSNFFNILAQKLKEIK